MNREQKGIAPDEKAHARHDPLLPPEPEPPEKAPDLPVYPDLLRVCRDRHRTVRRTEGRADGCVEAAALQPVQPRRNRLSAGKDQDDQTERKTLKRKDQHNHPESVLLHYLESQSILF